MTEPKMVAVTTAQERFTSWVSDVLVYTVVLNLFDEYASAIIIESFTISLFTAAVLKVLLDLLIFAEHRVSGFFGEINKVLGILSMWVLLFLSKFIILEVIDWIFGDEVELGTFLDVVVLVLGLMVTRALVAKVYESLGVKDDPRPNTSGPSAQS